MRHSGDRAVDDPTGLATSCPQCHTFLALKYMVQVWRHVQQARVHGGCRRRECVLPARVCDCAQTAVTIVDLYYMLQAKIYAAAGFRGCVPSLGFEAGLNARMLLSDYLLFYTLLRGREGVARQCTAQAHMDVAFQKPASCVSKRLYRLSVMSRFGGRRGYRTRSWY